jgi:hypothetical protein
MMQLEYLTDAPYRCSTDDVNVMAFTEATAIIRGRDVVEEFLACGIWPLSEGWEYEVETKESPLSKVVVVTLIIGKEEMGWPWIAAAANQLVGNYSAMEHNACAMQADAKGDPDYRERGDGGGLGLPRQRTSWLGITGDGA